jgi:hypothetical protein
MLARARVRVASTFQHVQQWLRVHGIQAIHGFPNKFQNEGGDFGVARISVLVLFCVNQRGMQASQNAVSVAKTPSLFLYELLNGNGPSLGLDSRCRQSEKSCP